MHRIDYAIAFIGVLMNSTSARALSALTMVKHHDPIGPARRLLRGISPEILQIASEPA
jgi:hypothetical protein